MVTFHGERLRGRYVLFRTDGKNWMIHRMDPPEDPDREPMPKRIEPMLARTGELPGTTRTGRTRSSGTACARSATSRAAGCGSRPATAATSRRATPSCAGSAARWRAHEAIARRRGRRVRRRPAELPAAPGAHAPDLREPRPPAVPERTRRLHDLRPAVARRPLADRPALHGAPRAAARARPPGRPLADAGAPRRRRRGDARGLAGAGARGHHRQAARLPRTTPGGARTAG